MTNNISTVHIMVNDPDAALPFYRDALGLKVTNEVENEGYKWITLVGDDQPEVSVVLSQPEPGQSKEDGEALAALLAKGAFMPIHFRTDDLTGLFDKLSATAGVEVLQEPTDQFWGVKDAAVRDPAGNTLRIEQA